ncbi:putative bifunctional diguanylate cyclase/phosphodiesterase [Ilumatobacter coccineus]|nr:EAL domain-containing protein [Ilumatobacter coccineus]
MSSRTVTQHHYEGGLLTGVLNSSHDGIMAFETVRDDRDQIVDFRWSVLNPAAAQIIERTAIDVIGRRVREEMPCTEEVFERYVDVVESGEPATIEYHVEKQGDDHWFLQTSVSLGDGLAVTFRDITEQRRLQRSLEHQAMHDQLTSLPNRILIEQRIADALIELAAEPSTVTVLFIDIDRFKLINDGLGHAAGDALLVQFAERLRSVLRPADSIARLSGDEFVVLLGDGEIDADGSVIERVLEACRAPYRVLDREVFASATIGVARADTPDVVASDLIATADRAMYGAKVLGGDRIAYACRSEHADCASRIALEADLHHAIDNDELRLVYQPIVSCESGDVVGAEALIRWQHPERGLVNPGEFLPIAEVTGLIRPIGVWALGAATRQLVRWIEAFPETAPDTVSVNVAAQQLVEAGFADTVRAALTEAGLAPDRLCIEVTETALIHEPKAAGETLRELADLGCEIALDDFGTGYSPLSYLRQFPVDAIKIDRSFVSGEGATTSNEELLQALIQFATMLGKQITAEGVEDAAQLALVRNAHRYQGFHFSRPLVPDDFSALLDR